MDVSKIKKNAVQYLIIGIAFLTALIAYFFLPDQIPMQWKNADVIWSANKIAIFAIPIISVIYMVFFSPRVLARAKESVAPTNFGKILSIGILLILFSNEVYTILYCFGFRWYLEYILIVEFALLLVIFLAEIFRPFLQIRNKQP